MELRETRSYTPAIFLRAYLTNPSPPCWLEYKFLYPRSHSIALSVHFLSTLTILHSFNMDNALSSSPSLLPAFEPVSRKRKYEGNAGRALMRDYLTPVPTSSTDILQSSPPPRPTTRPALDRTESNASERVPLGALPSVEIPLNGEYVLMGRSTQASHVQLSASRLISRVHVRASYTCLLYTSPSQRD